MSEQNNGIPVLKATNTVDTLQATPVQANAPTSAVVPPQPAPTNSATVQEAIAAASAPVKPTLPSDKINLGKEAPANITQSLVNLEKRVAKLEAAIAKYNVGASHKIVI